MCLTLYGFYCQYKDLSKVARWGSGTRAGYEFLVKILQRSDSIYEARMSVLARLVSLGREANALRGSRQNAALDQIAVLEHFLEEIKGR